MEIETNQTIIKEKAKNLVEKILSGDVVISSGIVLNLGYLGKMLTESTVLPGHYFRVLRRKSSKEIAQSIIKSKSGEIIIDDEVLVQRRNPVYQIRDQRLKLRGI